MFEGVSKRRKTESYWTVTAVSHPCDEDVKGRGMDCVGGKLGQGEGGRDSLSFP